MIALARQLADETIVVLFNASRETRALDLPLGGDTLPFGGCPWSPTAQSWRSAGPTMPSKWSKA